MTPKYQEQFTCLEISEKYGQKLNSVEEIVAFFDQAGESHEREIASLQRQVRFLQKGSDLDMQASIILAQEHVKCRKEWSIFREALERIRDFDEAANWRDAAYRLKAIARDSLLRAGKGEGESHA